MVDAVLAPSVIVSVMAIVVVFARPATGVIDTVREAPMPPGRMSAFCTIVGSLDVAVTPSATGLIVKAIGKVCSPDVAFWPGIAEIVSGASTAPLAPLAATARRR